MKQRYSIWRHFWPLYGLLLLILTSCSVPGVPTTSARLPEVRSASASPILPPIRFPQDEAPHRNLTEWWYYTGHLSAVTADGEKRSYGFELVFFQSLRSDLPPFYNAHFAISDLNRREFHYDQRSQVEPGASIPDGSSTRGFAISISDWSVRGLAGKDTLQATLQDYAIRLDLSSLKPPALHNGNGLFTYGLGGFSYYYSRTRMAVSGTLQDHQQSLTVSGEAWMDHQWGDFLSLGSGGWDWYSLQLTNHSELMFSVVRDPSTNRSYIYGDYIKADGERIDLQPAALNIRAQSTWTSSVTGITYPSGWRIEVRDPHLTATFTLQPQLKDQELVVTSSTGNIYWEGSVSIMGQSDGQSVDGQGYVELTGYTASAAQ